ncbi:PREDICTED: LOW QUALITY PROTEIN: cold shock domain-containing protein E1-like [Acropora digitifera]|uniref:LOW QUALITY PROTEIN: cold shock domain-containing protein E1-like n=1 Tax=Acropora digitifera TaxID=70779 RepID=UPI00077AADB9|nr:PREDICTED: LOW QUALITY PROTEIN: cold shock domain-containing protein E1-like [Acropora digitifera]
MTTETWRISERRDRTRTSQYDFNEDYYIGNHNARRTFSCNGNSFTSHTSVRETGVIEKLLHSYGFIQCCERDLRIFFHYSQINEDPEDLHVGGLYCIILVVAAKSIKISDILAFQLAYQSPLAEFFYLSFSSNDVVNTGTPLHKGDKVEFYVTTDKRTGVVRAREITLLEAVETERYQGVVSSMKESFGFIERADKVSEIFFHYSEFCGEVSELMLCDDVEFGIQVRNGKEVAVRIKKLPEGTVKFEDVSTTRYTGTVDRPLSKSASKRQHDPLHGKIVYTVPGNGDTEEEIVFSERDLQGDLSLRTGDIVEFNIAVDCRDLLKRATNISLVNVAEGDGEETREMVINNKLFFIAPYIRGVVSSMKESFGFIERADKVSEIFFHYSEFCGEVSELMLCDDVEFGIQVRNGKEVAVRIKKLPEGTVKFEDVSTTRYTGTVDRPLSKSASKRQHDPLHGKIVYTVPGNGDTEEEIVFSERDLQGDLSLRTGDIVEFNIAVDCRDLLKRATNISLVNVAEGDGEETREMGVVASLKEGFGFIRCCDRDARMFFHFSELLDSGHQVQVGDEVEFAVSEDMSANKRIHGVRVRVLPKGTIQMENVASEIYQGLVEREPCYSTRSPRKDSRESESGLINSYINGTRESLPFDMTNFEIRAGVQYGDKVEFNLSISQRTGFKRAVNVTVIKRNSEVRHKGFVATLKENFGFLETSEHDKEVFFHYSEFDGDPGGRRFMKHRSYSIQITKPECFVLCERVQQAEYSGLIMRIVSDEQDSDEEAGAEEEPENQDLPFTLEYGITSLVDKKTVLQLGEKVRFHIGVDQQTGKERAMKIFSVRQRVRARVESLKGQFGFIAYENEEGKNLFFHMSEVEGEVELQPGDEVEFVVVQNQKTRKMSACSVRRICDSQRPERLMRRNYSEKTDSPGPK